jgi:Tol biopolymer transport system component
MIRFVTIASVVVCITPAARAAPPYSLKAEETPGADWAEHEGRLLSNVRQLTSVDMGLEKAGEAYFSPDQRTIIFQAFPKCKDAYQMYTMELTADGQPRRDSLRMVSAGGGACTCGFFRPDGRKILFGSSALNPDMPNPNAYHREGSSYQWDMPGGMDVLIADPNGANAVPLTTTAGYDAECAFSPDGKWIVFCSDRDGDPDLYVMSADDKVVRQLTNEPGYDGGPFFSPDGRRVIFRSDRRQNDYLQLFVITVDGSGEQQLTADGEVVNWAPYWLPGGRSVVFTTSLHGHRNYEVYLLNIESGDLRRVTFSPRFDGLPVISPDGRRMMWTSQRGADGSSQIFLGDFRTPNEF